MPDIFTAPFAGGVPVDPVSIVVRLLVALLLGALVAWIYTRTTTGNTDMGTSFPTTLILLAVLISMVTQVIGDNVARAFSLVGALSIVRFRTVVRDTKDTAFVIFAVAVGMSVGAHNLWVAGIGIVVVGAAAFIFSGRSKVATNGDADFLLTVRIGLGYDHDKLITPVLERHLSHRRLMSVATAKQGTAIEQIYEAHLRAESVPEELVKALNLLEGVQDVQLQRRGFEVN